jgi:hypothetical protein
MPLVAELVVVTLINDWLAPGHVPTHRKLELRMSQPRRKHLRRQPCATVAYVYEQNSALQRHGSKHHRKCPLAARFQRGQRRDRVRAAFRATRRVHDQPVPLAQRMDYHHRAQRRHRRYEIRGPRRLGAMAGAATRPAAGRARAGEAIHAALHPRKRRRRPEVQR